MPTLPSCVYLQPVVVLATSEPDANPLVEASATGRYIQRIEPNVPAPAAEMVSLNQVLTKTFSGTPFIWETQLRKEYQDLGEALTQMTDLDEGTEWAIERPVYETACFIAAGLMVNSFPAPRVFNHGPKSVVFNWSDEKSNNLYLTVSVDRISALISSPERIKTRLDYSAQHLLKYDNLLSSIRSAQLEQPVLMLASGNSDPSESVG
jgi:hypothetical protein